MEKIIVVWKMFHLLRVIANFANGGKKVTG